jgi:hypothetical protein
MSGDPSVPAVTITRCPGGKTSSVWLHRPDVRPLMVGLCPNKSADELAATLRGALADAYHAGVREGAQVDA